MKLINKSGCYNKSRARSVKVAYSPPTSQLPTHDLHATRA